MKILVPVKQIAALDEDFELLDDGSGVDPDYLDYELNEWDDYSYEEALRIMEAHDECQRSKSSRSPSARMRPMTLCGGAWRKAANAASGSGMTP